MGNRAKELNLSFLHLSLVINELVSHSQGNGLCATLHVHLFKHVFQVGFDGEFAEYQIFSNLSVTQPLSQ